MAPPASDAGSRFVVRSISAIAVAVPAVAAIYFGFPYFDALVALVVAALCWEWDALCAGGRFRARHGLVLMAFCLAAVGLASAGRPGAGLIAVAAGCVVAYGTARAVGHDHAGLHALGAAYVGLPSVAILWLRHGPPDGMLTVLWMVLAVTATDVGAYAAGRTIGGPRLAPRVSPKKTWAGLAGGAACAALVGAVFGLAVGGRAVGGLGLWGLAGASALLAVVSQAGDLLESSVKRRFGVKDMGAIIPGHGGAFDRVDGHLAAAVAVAAVGLALKGDALAWR